MLFMAIGMSIKAKIPANHRVRLTQQWEFLQGDLGNVWEAVRPIKNNTAPEAVPVWQTVTLPHCFNAEDAVAPDVNYYQGPGWYRTLLDLRNSPPNGRIILEFEGAGQKTDVYIYTQKVGSHIGGYDEWSIDITEVVKHLLQCADLQRFKGKIPLTIRCDNSRDTEMIPSDMSDFNVYGGLYRYVNLVYQPALSFNNLRIETPVQNDLKNATLKVQATFHNPDDIHVADVQMIVKNPEGKVVTCQTATNILPLGRVQLFEISIKNPQLWSPNSPQLYTCEFTLKTPQSEQTVTEKVGFRHYEFIDNGPFKLNGERLLLRGTHRHEDHAGVGAAMTEELMRTEMKMIKDMGANFIRLGHYQQSDIILQLCDELGILVWEEIPWCRGGVGGESYRRQVRRILTNMIDQHHNHPSIILWGMGNENDWPNDFPTFEKSDIRSFMKGLNDLAHSLDPSRVTCIRRCDFCRDIVDIYSPSIWAGWYQGQFSEYRNMTETQMERVKHFLHVEWGGDSHTGRHAEDPFKTIKDIDAETNINAVTGKKTSPSKSGDWSETYICRLVDWHLKEQENMPNLTGSAYWTFKDFSTPLRPKNPIPYVNQKGIIGRDFAIKEVYYVFQSYWSPKAMVHIYGHSWETRWGTPGEIKDILVYSNCPKVELFVNGISQGVKQRNSQDYPAAGLRWGCVLQEGKNEIKAVAVNGKKNLTDEVIVNYQTTPWQSPAVLNVTSRFENEHLACVEVQITDANGIPCLDASNRIKFGAAGGGKLIQNQGTVNGSSKVEACNGKAKIYVKVEDSCCVSIQSEGMKTVYINLDTQEMN